MKIQRSIRLDPEVDETLRVLADRKERSVSQLIEMAVRMNYMAPPGSRSQDGRESARTKASRERGAYQPGSVEVDVPAWDDVEPASSGVPLWRCASCGWEKRALTPRSCPRHGMEPVVEVS